MSMSGVITKALQNSDDPMVLPNWLPWRIISAINGDEKEAPSIYVQLRANPSDEDELIGSMTTEEHAKEVARVHNYLLEHVQGETFSQGFRLDAAAAKEEEEREAKLLVDSSTWRSPEGSCKIIAQIGREHSELGR